MTIYTLATPARRLGGYFLDVILSLVLLGLTVSFFNNASSVIILLPIFWGVFWANGTSPGKAILDMKVINKDTRIIAGFGTMFLREIIGKFISHLVFYLGFVWILLDDKHQGWHDKFVNTIVVMK